MNDKVISKEEALNKLGYIKLKDKEYRGEMLKGRIIFSNKILNVGIFIQNNSVIKYGSMEIESLSTDELNAVYHYINAPIELDNDVEEAIGKIRKELGYVGEGSQVCFKELELLKQALSDKDKMIELTNDMAQKQQENDKKAFKHMQFISQGHLNKLNAIEAVATISDENYRKYSNGDKLNTILQILRRDSDE